MNNNVKIGFVGGAVYTVGLLWQIFELIRNFATDTESIPWMVYFLSFILIAVLVALSVIYINFCLYIRYKEPSFKRKIVFTASAGMGVTVSGTVTVITAIEILRYNNSSLLTSWIAILISPSFLMFLGSLISIGLSVSMFIKKKND